MFSYIHILLIKMSKLVCNSCAVDIEVIEANLTVTCFVCEKSFHGFTCIGLSKPQLKFIKDVKGLLWSCDHCAITTFQKYVCNKLNEISLNESSVKSQDAILSRIDSLSLEVLNLKKNVDALNVLDVDNSIGAKRFRSGRPMTPSSNTTSFAWPTKASSSTSSNNAVTGTNLESTTLKVIDAPLYFHVSRFSTETSETELESWISDKLDLSSEQHVKCTKLVPRGRELSSLEFISFMVAIPSGLELKVMDASIWPTNITVRPFEQRPFLQRTYPSIQISH